MTQQNLVELAKQGNPDAIAALINRQLQPKGITAKADLRDSCLQVMLESAQGQEQEELVAFIRKGVTSLGTKSIKKVKVYGKRTGEEFPDWSQEIELEINTKSTVSKPERVQHKTSSVQPVVQTKPLKKTNVIVYHQQNNQNKNHIRAIVSLSILILLISISTGLLFWQRSVQMQTLIKAQTLLTKAINNDSVSDLTSLSDSRNQLEEVVKTLNKAPDFPLPGSMHTQLKLEEEKVIARLKLVVETIKVLEQIQPEAQLALDQFSALNSRLDVGMNYRRYSDHVSELKVALDRFAQQPGANKHPYYKSLEDAFKDYNFALDVWRYYVESDENHNFFPASSSYGSILITEYKVGTEDIIGEEYINLNRSLATVWSRASQHLKLAQGKFNDGVAPGNISPSDSNFEEVESL